MGGSAPRRLIQSRGIHIPRRPAPPSRTAEVLRNARTILNRFISQLAKPGIGAIPNHAGPRVFRPSTIQQSLSLPARVSLSRPLRPLSLPRSPAVPGNVTQVGLGSARKFSTARPIFQNLAQNVPITGRAFWEADWDLKVRKEEQTGKNLRKFKKSASKPSKKLQNQDQFASLPMDSVSQEQLEHFFPAPSASEATSLTTYLQIPLAPTPTSRVPLPLYPAPQLLPLSALGREHASHSKHAIRVASIFRRLDAARVWERGATCNTYGDPSGLCTLLVVAFKGWDAVAVQHVLGHGGKEWCTIQEVAHPSELSGTSSPVSCPSSLPSRASTPVHDIWLGPASGDTSFVMPSMDLGMLPVADTATARCDSESYCSDSEYEVLSSRTLSRASSSWDAMSDANIGVLGFSSEFSQRLRVE